MTAKSGYCKVTLHAVQFGNNFVAFFQYFLLCKDTELEHPPYLLPFGLGIYSHPVPSYLSASEDSQDSSNPANFIKIREKFEGLDWVGFCRQCEAAME